MHACRVKNPLRYCVGGPFDNTRATDYWWILPETTFRPRFYIAARQD